MGPTQRVPFCPARTSVPRPGANDRPAYPFGQPRRQVDMAPAFFHKLTPLQLKIFGSIGYT
jgi:hypothetical protein